MSNPQIALQLSDVYEQATLQVKPKKPPKGFRPFEPRFREAMVIVSLDEPVYAKPVLVCPNCDSPRFYMDTFGLIWPKEQGLSDDDYLCVCIVCSARIWGFRPIRLPQCYYKPVKFRRDPEDRVDPDPYIEEGETEPDPVNRAVSKDDMRMVSAQIPVRYRLRKKHAHSRSSTLA